MQVKRFVANDMRSAMRLVKEEIGADAVILSNREVNGKIEILAARDYDEDIINQALDKTLIESKPDSAAAYYERAAAKERVANLNVQTKNPLDTEKVLDSTQKTTAEFLQQQETAAEFSRQQQNKAIDNEHATQNTFSTEHQAKGLMQASQSVPFDNGMFELRDELKSLRAMIENQNVLGEWSEMAAKYPLRISLYKRLTELGLSQDICKYLGKGLDDSADIEKAMQAALKQLVYQIPIGDDDILNKGGVYAMVGPTGVGKTTTIAKLAARFAMQHGQRHVALISTDSYRIGAHEQLMTYGRLLGVPVHTANDAGDLQQLLHKLHDKKLVLIDTAGMSQRDLEISQHLSYLSHPASKIKPYLVLSANAQLSTLSEVISAFKKANPVGCILTKLDEAASLGGILSAVMKHRLPIAFTSNGQKVPEDIKTARARDLVDQALEYEKASKESLDDEFIAVAFSSSMSHAPLG